MKVLQTAIVRFIQFLAIFIGLKSLIAWKLVFDWKDVFLAIIITIISLRQSQLDIKKEKEADRLAEERRKKEAW